LTKVIFKFRVDKNIKQFLDSQGEVNFSKIVNESLRKFIDNNESFLLRDNFQFEFNGYLNIGIDYDLYNEIKNISKRTGIRLFYLVNIALLYYISRSIAHGEEVTGKDGA